MGRKYKLDMGAVHDLFFRSSHWNIEKRMKGKVISVQALRAPGGRGSQNL
jgi:hypothetical protein